MVERMKSLVATRLHGNYDNIVGSAEQEYQNNMVAAGLAKFLPVQDFLFAQYLFL